MKKLSILDYLVLTAMVFSLTACGAAPENLAGFKSGTDNAANTAYYELNGIRYLFYGTVGNSLKGEQIGFANDDETVKIYAVKDYPASEWIIEKAHSVEMDSLILYKSILF